MQIAAFLVGVAAFCSAAVASNVDLRPRGPPPTLTHLYSLNCTLDPATRVGSGPYGERVVIRIRGGSFEGPRIRGTIRDLGADWGLTDVRGNFHPDTRYSLITDDGAEIYIRTFGSTQPNNGSFLHGLYETGSDKYWWLNNIVSVGVLQAGQNWVFINMYYMETNATQLA